MSAVPPEADIRQGMLKPYRSALRRDSELKQAGADWITQGCSTVFAKPVENGMLITLSN